MSVNYDDPMDIDTTTVLNGVTLPNSEPQRKSIPKYDRSNPPKPKSFPLKANFDPMLVRSSITLSKPPPHYLLSLSPAETDFRYHETPKFVSPYDAILPPRPLFGGSAPVLPLLITDENRPFLKNLSQIALDYYNDIINQKGRWGPSFEFHDLVKCTRGWNYGLNTSTYYITFQANAKGDTSRYITFQAYAKGDTSSSSSSPAIKTFQAQVSVYKKDKDKPPVVNECRIKF
ncbi:uncharacterized protein LOC123892507 isoform X1 [Trifolium pratense]|uniref:uncharacterized protein LOC123892507 isoform X1 n=1 Tax=Trifolium pratense TaxID=57577 RepID=UPI001E695227|nr:uncharacterized protein LOC123892507 isoform X1 [Trifolium pratense]XP_045798263.1 uncharacterized protein LOC123892507 isoform X1 [Trifolium pratense]XP_045798264.1 uncharacterized protein LOC123892507 isoform X1 [Trifolium pratense]XP_045798265.1 uncharacterized protein LOC123892507 isoform X1 [Trifolium pratense]XP_045798266.1 uncharacterized protein LOC123892507 isoform X1 [Trifolium pratense]XP_045798268.1 uncharacterized protein LOC123892507 isoform X1 [Trifolium pratense]